jgi:Chaperone of endosialidase
MVNSTPTSGNILKSGTPFIHDTGFDNAFVGANAGTLTTGSSSNSALGASALSQLTTGFANTAVGTQALRLNTVGGSNTALGRQALISNTTGSGNVALGREALANNTAGSSNIAVGFGAGGLTTGGNNILIGHFGAAGENSTSRIGFSQTRTFIAGIRGATTDVADGVAVLIDSNGQLGTVSSSRRFKDDVADMDAASAALMKLRPVTFHYKTERAPSERRLQYGLIAEEVAAVYPGLVAHSADGEVETVMYQYLPPMLLNEHQKLARTVQAQAARIDAQAQEIAELKQLSARMALALERLAPVNMARQ